MDEQRVRLQCKHLICTYYYPRAERPPQEIGHVLGHRKETLIAVFKAQALRTKEDLGYLREGLSALGGVR